MSEFWYNEVGDITKFCQKRANFWLRYLDQALYLSIYLFHDTQHQIPEVRQKQHAWSSFAQALNIV